MLADQTNRALEEDTLCTFDHNVIVEQMGNHLEREELGKAVKTQPQRSGGQLLIRVACKDCSK